MLKTVLCFLRLNQYLRGDKKTMSIQGIQDHMEMLVSKINTVISNQQAAMSQSRDPGTTEETGESTSGTALSSATATEVQIINPSATLTAHWRFVGVGDWVPISPGGTSPIISVTDNANEVEVKTATALEKIYAVIYE